MSATCCTISSVDDATWHGDCNLLHRHRRKGKNIMFRNLFPEFGYALLIVIFVILNIAITWAHKARPSDSVVAKYGKGSIFKFTFSFGKSWRQNIQEEDMSTIVEYRRRVIFFRLLLLSLFGFLYLIVYYVYIA